MKPLSYESIKGANMKLFFTPGTCALSPHIVLEELGLPYEAVKVDLVQKLTADGSDYRLVNPKGYVPALQIGDEVLTEGPAIVQYLADKAPERGLAPAPGTLERYRLVEWLNFVSAEIHKQFSNLFNRDAPDAFKEAVKLKLQGRFAYLNDQLARKDFLMGKAFSVADAYLYTVLRWAPRFNMSLEAAPALAAYVERIAARPAVKGALAAEGLT
jgi:glutathione S-transferase